MLKVTLEGPPGSGKTVVRKMIEDGMENHLLPYRIEEVESDLSVSNARPRFPAYIRIDDSEWIDIIEYDPDRQILDATLRNGDRYRYRGVSAEKVSRVIFSRSTGAAFNAEIKPLPYKRLPRKRKR